MKLLSEILWWSAVVTGCSQNVILDIQPNEVLNIDMYENGLHTQECNLISTSDFIKLFKNTSNEWTATPVTYVPYILVSGKNFKANFIGKKVVINNNDGQYIKDIRIKDYSFINCK